MGDTEKIIEKVEVYDESGVSYFELTDSETLKPDGEQHVPYFSIEDQGFNWTKIPLIPFKYNNKEIPLIKMVKSLQDGLNLIESNFQNQMEEDTRNTILVLVNYDGENLGEFRKNLATYGAVKVRTVEVVQAALALMGRQSQPAYVSYRMLYRECLGIDPMRASGIMARSISAMRRREPFSASRTASPAAR